MDYDQYLATRRSIAITMMGNLCVGASPSSITEKDVTAIVEKSTLLANRLRAAEVEETALANVYERFSRIPTLEQHLGDSDIPPFDMDSATVVQRGKD